MCPGRLLEVPKLNFSRFSHTFRYNVFNSAVWGVGLHKNRRIAIVNGGFSAGTTTPVNLLRFNINDASMNGYIRVLRRD